ncbi:MAG: pantoate--beta-alanine ligase [bacterium JZ-2024 1]
MKVVESIKEMRSIIRELRGEKKRIGLVPTMGYFHEGHLSLMRRARNDCDAVVVSIFVNPTQFGLFEDFERYPRDIPRDLDLAMREGVDFVFSPPVPEMYGPSYETIVCVSRTSQGLCGWARPGHFDGVATVVTKLFNVVQPDVAYFGAKDYQQSVVIRRMVEDLNLPVEIVVCPTVREPDGLAMSSRNTYLTAEERAQAPRIYGALLEAERAYRAGEKNASALRSLVRDLLEKPPSFRVDYVEIVHPDSLLPLKEIGTDGAVIAVAAFLGNTRLIDNIIVTGQGSNR